MTARLPAPALSSLADVTDERFTDEQRAHVARFDAAPVPVEVVVARLERLADLADNLDYYASKTTGGTHASGLSDAATQLRDALAGQHTTDEETDRG